MKLKRILLYHYNRPFEYSFESSHTKRTRADSLIAALEFSGGITGYGESAPREYVTGETIQTVCQSIKNHLAPVLFQSDIENLADVEHILTLIEKGNPGAARQIPSAIGCIDLALLDALGHYQMCNAGQFLDSPLREHPPLSLSLPFITPKDVKKKWNQLQSWLPVASVKLVMSKKIGSNRDRAAFIRDVIGPSVDMRIEVNGQWTYAEACQNLSALMEFNISGIEEPLYADDRHRLHQLRSNFEIPVILDESICTRDDAKYAIQSKSCDGINIKVSKCGGLIRSQSIMRMAAKENATCQIGTHVGESIILDLAGWQLARATTNLTYFEGCSFLLHNPRLSNRKGPPSRQSRTDLPGWGLTQDEIDHLLRACDQMDQIVG